jgi:hypothetical protein
VTAATEALQDGKTEIREGAAAMTQGLESGWLGISDEGTQRKSDSSLQVTG